MKNPKSKIQNTKFRKIKLLILDVDGVLTDSRIIYDSQGSEYKIFNVQDGYGIELVKKRGVKVAIVSGRSSSIIDKRAHELCIEDVYQGVNDKITILKELLIKYKLDPKEICAIGDDILDLGLMKRVGFPIAVKNARPEIKKISRYITNARGGEGAVREVVDMILGHL